MSNTATLADDTIAEPLKPVITVTTTPRFTSLDRCDSCGAQAYIGATINGTELTFCAHHGHKSEAKLRALATAWHDESAKLHEEQANRIKE